MSFSTCPTVTDDDNNDIHNLRHQRVVLPLRTCQDASGVIYALKLMHYAGAVDYDRKCRQLTGQLQVSVGGFYTLRVYARWTDNDEIVVATKNAVFGKNLLAFALWRA